MRTPKPNPSAQDRVVYSEFGTPALEPNAIARPEIPVSQQTLKIQAERKGRKGKTVTVITGFQAQPSTLADLCKQLKGQCGAGGAVKDNQIEIQGDQRQSAQQFLTKLGYKVKLSGG
jgi:translation initiation factor 1